MFWLVALLNLRSFLFFWKFSRITCIVNHKSICKFWNRWFRYYNFWRNSCFALKIILIYCFSLEWKIGWNCLIRRLQRNGWIFSSPIKIKTIVLGLKKPWYFIVIDKFILLILVFTDFMFWQFCIFLINAKLILNFK